MLGYTKTAVTIESFHIRRLIFRYQQAYLKNMPAFAYRGQWILKNNERSVRTNLAKSYREGNRIRHNCVQQLT